MYTAYGFPALLIGWRFAARQIRELATHHNALKLGFDVDTLCYPELAGSRIAAGATPELSPEAVAPGTPVGELESPRAIDLVFPAIVPVCAGTTRCCRSIF
jgi:hypothetical protein